MAIEKSEDLTESLSVNIPPSEFILGIADLTGELMRNAINALGAGNMEVIYLIYLQLAIKLDLMPGLLHSAGNPAMHG